MEASPSGDRKSHSHEVFATMKYLRNAWYVAGFADEIPAGGMFARTLLGMPVVFFRGTDGVLAALEDRCPHRFAPLSKGIVCDGGLSIQCPYHGLRFNREGACVLNPHASVLPKAARVSSFAVREKDRLIWLWAGTAETADDSLIPDFAHVTSAPMDATIRGHLPTRCHYELLVDNILDLTHADFLHAGTLGSGAIARTRAKVTDLSPRSARITWISRGDRAPHALDMHLRQQEQPTDQWTEVTWHAPGYMLLEVGATLQDESKDAGVNTFNLHLATPESDELTHYWYWSTRNFAISPEANAAITRIVEFAFSQQDKPILEAQQRNLGGSDFWALKPVLLPSDAGAVRVRRKLAALMAAEDPSVPISQEVALDTES
jgi:vanillate O-demethylase monooxygenase subunit